MMNNNLYDKINSLVLWGSACMHANTIPKGIWYFACSPAYATHHCMHKHTKEAYKLAHSVFNMQNAICITLHVHTDL